MTDADRAPARDPQDLERLLVARQRSGDMVEKTPWFRTLRACLLDEPVP